MGPVPSQPPAPRADEAAAPPALGDRATSDLAYIRDTMERAGSFTVLSGLGGVLMGAVALAGAALAARRTSVDGWLATWLGAAAVAIVLGVAALQRKAARAGQSLLVGGGWRFLLATLPALAAGVALTFVFWRGGLAPMLPGVWLLLYGAALLAGALFSLPLIRWMGLAFMAAGVGALSSPPAWGDAWMAVGFGGLNLAFGLRVMRRHGG